MKIDQLRTTLLNVSRTTLLSGIGIFAIAVLMLVHLASLTPGISAVEVGTMQTTSSLSAITDNMVHAPYKTAVYLSTRIFDSTFGLRLTGAVVGGLSIALFYLVTRKLYGTYIALIVTVMFGSSSLLLHSARLATPNVMLLSLLALIAVGFYLRFGKRKDIGWILTAITVGLSLYTPGMILFIVAASLWQFRHVKRTFEQLGTPVIIIASVIFGLVAAPFIISIVRDFDLWRAYLGVPEALAPFNTMVKYAGTAVASLFIITPRDPVYWLGRQPVLDVFATVMFVYGSFHLLRQYRLDRLWTIGGIFVLATLWIGATTNRWAILVLLPFVYLVVGIGIQKFINIWLKVFPLNPIARIIGSTFLLAAIVLSINFQVYRYFVAWPNADATKEVFTHQYQKR